MVDAKGFHPKSWLVTWTFGVPALGQPRGLAKFSKVPWPFWCGLSWPPSFCWEHPVQHCEKLLKFEEERSPEKGRENACLLVYCLFSGNKAKKIPQKLVGLEIQKDLWSFSQINRLILVGADFQCLVFSLPFQSSELCPEPSFCWRNLNLSVFFGP